MGSFISHFRFRCLQKAQALGAGIATSALVGFCMSDALIEHRWVGGRVTARVGSKEQSDVVH